jgi:hypothetical protein
MDISTTLRQDANTPTRMVLRHYATGLDLEDEEGKKVALLVMGADSDAAKRCDRDYKRRMREAAVRRRDGQIPPEMWEEYVIEMAVATTVGWEHASYKGTAEFSADLIRQFYRAEPWALEQHQEFIADRAHFSGASKTA